MLLTKIFWSFGVLDRAGQRFVIRNDFNGKIELDVTLNGMSRSSQVYPELEDLQ